MKILLCCLVEVVFSLALADVQNIKEHSLEKDVDLVPSDKSSDSKLKRDASLLGGGYHGTSYKYLPPASVSSLYDSYSGNVGHSGFSSGFSSGVGGGYSSSGFGHGHGHGHIGVSSSNAGGAIHRLSYAPSNYHSSSHHGLGYTSSGYYGGHGLAQHSGGIKGGSGSSGVSFGYADFSGGRTNTYALGHGTSGSSSSGSGYKSNPHPLSAGHVGLSSGSGSGYYSKGGFPSSVSSGFGSGHSFGNSHGSGLGEVHHTDHVHNGGQEHIYTVASGIAGIGNSLGTISAGQQGGHVIPTASYLTSIEPHPVSFSSYGVPIATVGDAYNSKHNSKASNVVEHGPAYASGHKGLGHFGFTANKPQVLHTSISGSSFKQPSYSKAPFKPSTFLGAKYEESQNNDVPGQHYLPPSGVGSDTTGYDYPIPSGPSIIYQEPGYQQSVDVQATSIHEPDSSYLPPNNNEASFNEISSAPSGSYLTPSNTYGVPYSH